jgi:GT2 family glycosyltransferase
MVEVSVVVPTLGNHDVLARVLDGYERQDAPAGSFEVLVVADRHEPDIEAVRAAAAGRRYPLRLLRGAQPGASANRNTGWQAAAGALVLFADADTIPLPRLVSEHLRWHRRWSGAEVAVVGPVRWARDVEVTPFMRWLQDELQFQYRSIRGREAGWGHLYTANCSIKRAMLERVGGFDEQRLPYGYEDIEWAYRASRHGLRVLFNRRAVVEHHRTMTLADWQARARRLAVSEWRFCQLHPEIPPFFQSMFAAAAGGPRYGRRAARLASFVPRWLPVIGPRVWDHAGHHWRREIAPHFLAVWEACARGEAPPLEPAASAAAERSTVA